MAWRTGLCLLISSLFLVNCARNQYVKVPTPTQYKNWTDEDQRKADAMNGVRYYLPRPFLHLKQSIPVAQRMAIVSFRLAADKTSYELVPPPSAAAWVGRLLPTKISITQALAMALAKGAASGKEDGGGIQGGEEGPDTAKQPATSGAEEKSPSELTVRTGYINEDDPVTRLSDKMDVVYLPDFEEQYIIQPHPGLGKADIEVRLRNGWAAESFSYKVDNSNLIPYVINQVQKASKAAADIYTTWPPRGMRTGEATADQQNKPAAGLQGKEEEAAKFLSDILIFKVAEVRVAQPGLYPILKPREIQQYLNFNGTVIAADPEAAFEEFIRQSKTPWIRPDMAFIPCPPVTMIGFNTTTDVFIALASDRIAMTAAETLPPPVPPQEPTDVAKDLNSVILNGTNLSASVEAEADNTMTVHLQLVGSTTGYTERTREELRTMIVNRLKETGHEDEKKYRIEFPLTQPQLDQFVAQFNKIMADDKNCWQIKSLKLEYGGKNDCSTQKNGNCGSKAREEFVDKLKLAFDIFCVEQKGGSRPLEIDAGN